MASRTKSKASKGEEESASAQTPPKHSKRKRAPPVSTASTLQANSLYASTRDEVREIQNELKALAEERKTMIEQDASGRKAVLSLLPPSEKKI